MLLTQAEQNIVTVLDIYVISICRHIHSCNTLIVCTACNGHIRDIYTKLEYVYSLEHIYIDRRKTAFSLHYTFF